MSPLSRIRGARTRFCAEILESRRLLSATLLRSVPNGAYNHVTIGSTLYFIGTDAQNDEALWKTDGTNTGTKIVMDTVQSAPDSEITIEGEHLPPDHSVIIMPTGEVIPNEPSSPTLDDC